MVFSGMVLFENNRHHSEGLSGALYLSSFGQMLLEINATLNFTGNLGRFVIHTCRVDDDTFYDIVHSFKLTIEYSRIVCLLILNLKCQNSRCICINITEKVSLCRK